MLAEIRSYAFIQALVEVDQRDLTNAVISGNPIPDKRKNEHQRLCNSKRRGADFIGIERVARDVTPSLSQIIEEEMAAEEAERKANEASDAS
jgi:hypothetical protein